MNAPESIALRKEAFEANKLKKRLRRLVGQLTPAGRAGAAAT